MKKKVNGRTIFNIIVAIFIISIFGYLCLSKNGLSDLLKESRSFKKYWLVLAVLCHFINLFIDNVLVYKFARTAIPQFTFKNAVKISMIGQFFSAVTPSATGGQPMQIYAMSTKKIDPGASTSALIQKFLVYQTVLTIYGILAILIKFSYFFSLDKIVRLLTTAGFIAQAIVICALIIFSFNKKFTHKVIVFIFTLLSKVKIIRNPENKITRLESNLEIFHKGNSDLYKNKRLLIETHLLTALQIGFYFLIPYCIFRSFNLQTNAYVVDMLCAQAFINMVSWIVPLPGASGGAEAASAVFLHPFFDETTIKSAVVITRIISYYLTIAVSAPFSRLSKQKNITEVK